MPVAPQLVRFGLFELDLNTGELCKNGHKLKLQEQPFRLLVLLLEQPGQPVTRDRLKDVLWPSDTFVDFDHSLNAAVAKLRQALGDSAENPRFIETLPRRGYRFLGQIERLPRTDPEPHPAGAGRQHFRRWQKLPAIAIASGIVLTAAVIWLTRRLDRTPNPSTPLPLTAAAGWERDPSFSPDGNQIVYAWDETGTESNFHIYVKMLGSGQPVRLTAGPASDIAPAWSPDGRSIAFLRMLNDATAIYVIPALGGSERKLIDGVFPGPFSWSSDGSSLVAPIGSPEDPPSFYLIATGNGEKIRRLTTPPDARTVDQNPVFSPDGRMLLFTRCDGPYRCGLFLLDLVADYRPKGQPRVLVLRRERTGILGATWTTDGKEVIYALSEDGAYNPHLMRLRVETGALPHRLTIAGDDVNSPVVAPRGNRLVYIQSFADADLWQVQPGKSPRPFVSSRREDDSPQFSPDGTRVAFSSNRSGLMQIWVCDAGGKNAVQLTHFDTGHSGTPRWSPDGRWIAFDHQLEEGWRILLMAADGGQLRRLTQDRHGDEVIPSWSADGKSIYYACNRTGRFQIWRASAQEGKGTQVTHNGGWVAFESPDGRSLYYRTLESPVLWTLPLAGGNERQVLDFVDRRGFAVMDDGIYYLTRPRPDGGSSINFHRFATGKNEEIARFKEQAYAMALAIAPDRKTIVFPVMARTGSNVMVLENFR